MPYSKPFQVECFYSCDKELALELLSGKTELDPSENLVEAYYGLAKTCLSGFKFYNATTYSNLCSKQGND